MGPNRILHNRRGRITEVVFDEERGIFTERLFQPPVAPRPAAVGEDAASTDPSRDHPDAHFASDDPLPGRTDRCRT